MKVINFETAKLAKEKNISIICDLQYDEFGNIVDTLYQTHYFKAPCQYQVMDWLREKHNIHIEISIDNFTDKDTYQYSIIYICEFHTKSKSGGDFKDYYECLETALQEALKMI